MALSVLATLATLRSQGRAFLRSRFPSAGVNDAQFLGKLANVVGMAMFGLQRTAEQIDRDSPPNTKTSTLGLDTWAFCFGLPSNAGGYGRNQATASTGGVAPVTGTPGAVVAAGQQLTAPDGTTVIQCTNGGTIPFSGTFSAITAGTVGNLGVGTVLTWISPPAGCDATVTLSSALANAIDQEQNAPLLSRTLQRTQTPPKGGANIDYQQWATENASVPAYQAYVYPRRQGTGTVDIVITQLGSGAGRSPLISVQNAVIAFIASIQPTNIEGVNVLLPYQPASKNLTIRVRATTAIKYGWDWIDTATSYTIAAYSAGTPSITLNVAAPASLIAAVDSGLKPRVQVVSTANGAPVVPDMRRVIAYNGTKTMLTLDSPLSTTPNNGDAVYAGSYTAPLVGAAVLAYVDRSGPSRASGYADVITPWNDTVAIFTVAQTALDAIDTDGITKLLSKVSSVTIAVGNGAPAAVDYTPADDGNNPPELPVAAHVVCTQ
jgi:hypothetical protein